MKAAHNHGLNRTGLWAVCIGLVIFSPIGWTAGVILPFVEFGLRRVGIDHFPLEMLFTYIFLTCALRLVVELWMRGYFVGR